ncbi:MAG: GYDIA family GHMP kinase [Flavobacteriia bacterium]|nr:GYDIA family GHMP kinase [Flavobacteriia bacterium]
MSQSYYSHGKLLLSGEYLVIDGVSALAIPCRFGQVLRVRDTENGQIAWKAYSDKKECWAHFSFALKEIDRPFLQSPKTTQEQLLQILSVAKALNPTFLKNSQGIEVETHLEFPQDWGLGSSSTLINNIANWTGVNPYELLEKTMGGSGYDIACAAVKTPILYHRDLHGFSPKTESKTLAAALTEQLVFVHLNQKQKSSSGIQQYKTQKAKHRELFKSSCKKIEALSIEMASCTELTRFLELMRLHETIISELLELPAVQPTHFSDFKGQIKSLGAWGGDFVLAGSKELNSDQIKAYFNSKGYGTSLSYSEMVLI